MTEKQKNWHDKSYKLLLLIPVIITLLSVVYMVNFHSTHGDFIYKDISLTGGTSVTIYEQVNANDLEQALSDDLENLNTRVVSDLFTREQKALIIKTKADGDTTKQVLEDYLDYELIPGENADFEFTGSALSESFYNQLLTAILIAFVFMGIVVFIIFRTFVPSSAVIISALLDIFMTLTLVNILGMQMSTAGIVAFLMLIGYSVDTDILLTTRLLKRRQGSLNSRIYSAFQTGITMTLTSMLAVVFALIIVKPFSVILTQIFAILAIGLGFDILNTWITNTAILKWYIEKKNKKGGSE
ncbi:MMPL family transporter [Candidatus Pacearchaeota archaeon]|nr:MMPL family transporter [Candidatus Pacearchaeota archaeon]